MKIVTFASALALSLALGASAQAGDGCTGCSGTTGNSIYSNIVSPNIEFHSIQESTEGSNYLHQSNEGLNYTGTHYQNAHFYNTAIITNDAGQQTLTGVQKTWDGDNTILFTGSGDHQPNSKIKASFLQDGGMGGIKNYLHSDMLQTNDAELSAIQDNAKFNQAVTNTFADKAKVSVGQRGVENDNQNNIFAPQSAYLQAVQLSGDIKNAPWDK